MQKELFISNISNHKITIIASYCTMQLFQSQLSVGSVNLIRFFGSGFWEVPLSNGLHCRLHEMKSFGVIFDDFSKSSASR